MSFFEKVVFLIMSEKIKSPFEAEAGPTSEKEPDEEFEIGACKIEKEKIFYPDGKTANVVSVSVLENADFKLGYDRDFVHRGIVLEEGGLLINFAKTQDRWSRPAGQKPEDFLKNLPEGTVAVCPSNWGWQKGAFLIEDGQMVAIKNEAEELSGNFEVIYLGEKGWNSQSLQVEKGKAVESIKNMKIGFSMPLILKDGEVREILDYIGDQRLLGDLRNVFDFAAGEKLPADFWVLLRKFLPVTCPAGKRLGRGDKVVISLEPEAVTEEEIKRFQEIVSEHRLEDILTVSRNNQGRPRMGIISDLPMNRIPVVGIGITENGGLVIASIDGRQENSAGATIEELAIFLKEKGAVTAGLGCAGGDVAILNKAIEGSQIINSPSNPGNQTRPLPSILLIEKKSKEKPTVSIEIGNLDDKISANPERRGWFLGHFAEKESLFNSSEVEIKWAVYEKGEKYKEMKANKKAKTLDILVRGRVKIYFPYNKQTAVMEKPGDFVLWDAGVCHTVEALEDAVALCVRWPSIPDDSMSRKYDEEE
jgi:hypothetical protein